MILVAAVAVIQEQQVINKQKQNITLLVDRAVDQIQSKGEAAFQEFNSPIWYQGDTYIFVWRMDGIRVVYPPDQSGIGQNMTDLKDINGKNIGMLFIQTAKNGGGWVEYQWPKPGSKLPSTKITYIKPAKYQNQTYLVGCGVYI
ncbi:MAG: cache domain-containing protein [Methanobacterium sp.]|nr:cache domain-containing protein [Methanobacterium sp.]